VHVLDALAEFGLTGRVGLLHRGASLRDLASAYGPPWDIGRIRSRNRWPHLYSYGDVELVMCRCRLVASISVPTWRDTVQLPPPGPGAPRTVPARVTYAQVVDALAAVGCPWEPLPELEGQCGLRTEPERIDFTFVIDGPQPVLYGAASSSYAHECLPPAEVAARFPDDFPEEQTIGRLP
jgi:hypothetical protein